MMHALKKRSIPVMGVAVLIVATAGRTGGAIVHGPSAPPNAKGVHVPSLTRSTGFAVSRLGELRQIGVGLASTQSAFKPSGVHGLWHPQASSEIRTMFRTS